MNHGDPAAAEKFQEISAAYDVLSDDEKRARYDRFGRAGVNGGSEADFGFGGGFGPFSDIFDVFFGGGSRAAGPTQGPERGSDLRADVEITLEEVLQGVEK